MLLLRRNTKRKYLHMENLPDNVLTNIFIHLLAKQLAQMRCVCKSWNHLLSESYFVKSHLHHSIHNNDEILLFFQNEGRYFESNSRPITARPSHSPDLELTKFIKLKLPVDPQHKNKNDASCKVIGSVNGLICFSYQSDKDLVIRIWNPSLSLCLTLPPSSLSNNASPFAFGFDPKTDDYKVVRLARLFDVDPKTDDIFRVLRHASFSRRRPDTVSGPQGEEVYSMRKGSWESISQRIPSHIAIFKTGDPVCVDGHLHWLCVTYLERNPCTIMTFDLGAKTYGEIPLPDCIAYDRKRYRTVLGVLGGKLCVMSCITDDGSKCDVWVMGDDESWVKHHLFSQFNGLITPYGFTSRKEFLFRADNGCRFALYDPISDNSKIFTIKWTQPHDRYKVCQYVDSLVWIAPTSQLKLTA